MESLERVSEFTGHIHQAMLIATELNDEELDHINNYLNCVWQGQKIVSTIKRNIYRGKLANRKEKLINFRKEQELPISILAGIVLCSEEEYLRKENGQTEFKVSQIKRFQEFFKLSNEDIYSMFFE